MFLIYHRSHGNTEKPYNSRTITARENPPVPSVTQYMVMWVYINLNTSKCITIEWKWDREPLGTGGFSLAVMVLEL